MVIKTFLKHYKTRGQKYANGDTDETATDDIFFDECVQIPVTSVFLSEV